MESSGIDFMTYKEILQLVQTVALVVTALAAVAVPVVVAHIGASVAVATKESESRVKYVELAVSILQADPKPETQALRGWAVELLDSQAPAMAKLASEAKKQLQEKPLDLRPGTLSGNATLGSMGASGTINGATGK